MFARFLAAGVAAAWLAALPVAADAQSGPRKGGTVTIALAQEPSILTNAFNPAQAIAIVASKVMEGLVVYDLELKPQPALAESWALSQDGKQLTFNLRKGVKWHDGTDFTSADVKFSIEKVWKVLHPRGRTTWAKVEGVDAPDAHTVVVRLSEATPTLMSALDSYDAQVLPKHLYDGTDILENPRNRQPVGTGPFVFKEWARGNYILLERNPNYWQPQRPHLDKVVYRIMPDAAGRLAALETGEAHVGFFTPIPLSDVKRLTDTGKLAVETRGYEAFAPTFLLELNLANKHLADRRVRQALAHAIDRNAIVRIAWFGFGTPSTGPVPSILKQYYTSNVPKYPFDIKRAEQLLDEAGFKRGANGRRFKLIHDYLPYGSDYQRTAELLKQQLDKVGIELEIRGQDTAAFLKRVYTDRDFDVTSNLFFAFSDPTLGVQRIYWSKSHQKGVAFSNGSGYSNPKMDALLEAAQTESDPKKRVEQWHEIQKIAMEDVPVLPLFEAKPMTVYRTELVDVTTSAAAPFGSFTDARFK